MTLMHSGLILWGVWLLAKCLQMWRRTAFMTHSALRHLCSPIERESYQLCQTKNCAILFQDL